MSVSHLHCGLRVKVVKCVNYQLNHKTFVKGASEPHDTAPVPCLTDVVQLGEDGSVVFTPTCPAVTLARQSGGQALGLRYMTDW